MNPLYFLLLYVGEALLIVGIVLLLEWLRARRGDPGRSTEIRFGVYRDDPPTDDQEDG